MLDQNEIPLEIFSLSFRWLHFYDDVFFVNHDTMPATTDYYFSRIAEISGTR